MRITGLASGIDTEEMINSLMQAERVRVDRVEQDRQIVLWRQEMYNDINKDFANFILNTRKMFGLTSVTYTGSFVANSYKNLNWIKRASSFNENIARVSATSQAVDGNYRVNVKQLAEGASLASGMDIRVDEESIDEVDLNAIVVTKDGTIKQVIKDGEEKKLKDLEELKFTINGEEIKVEARDGKVTINSVVRAINSEESLNVRASYDSSIGRFFLQTTNTGKDAKITINAENDIGKNFINLLNLNYAIKDENGDIKYKEYILGEESVNGQNAVFDFNGAIGIESDTNYITINGITMDFIGTGEFTINVSTDVDGIYEKIEQFVEEYNELVEKTNQLLGEKRYRDYKPLTSEQKKAMDKEDIELWEEKAKSGLLRSDDLIGRTMLNVRSSLYEKSAGIDGTYQLITQIGISTEKYARGSAGGKLVIDEQKLREAIAKDPEGVLELLFKESDPDNSVEIDGKEVAQIGGVVTRIYENLMIGMEEIIKKSGTGDNAELYRGVKPNILLEFVSEYSSISLLDKDVLQYSRRIDELNEILFRKENQYYAKFAAMEKAIARMNSQSMWMMQQFMS